MGLLKTRLVNTMDEIERLYNMLKHQKIKRFDLLNERRKMRCKKRKKLKNE
jgi:hypothetical protein